MKHKTRETADCALCLDMGRLRVDPDDVDLEGLTVLSRGTAETLFGPAPYAEIRCPRCA